MTLDSLEILCYDLHLNELKFFTNEGEIFFETLKLQNYVLFGINIENFKQWLKNNEEKFKNLIKQIDVENFQYINHEDVTVLITNLYKICESGITDPNKIQEIIKTSFKRFGDFSLLCSPLNPQYITNFDKIPKKFAEATKHIFNLVSEQCIDLIPNFFDNLMCIYEYIENFSKKIDPESYEYLDDNLLKNMNRFILSYANMLKKFNLNKKILGKIEFYTLTLIKELDDENDDSIIIDLIPETGTDEEAYREFLILKGFSSEAVEEKTNNEEEITKFSEKLKRSKKLDDLTVRIVNQAKDSTQFSSSEEKIGDDKSSKAETVATRIEDIATHTEIEPEAHEKLDVETSMLQEMPDDKTHESSGGSEVNESLPRMVSNESLGNSETHKSLLGDEANKGLRGTFDGETHERVTPSDETHENLSVDIALENSSGDKTHGNLSEEKIISLIFETKIKLTAFKKLIRAFINKDNGKIEEKLNEIVLLIEKIEELKLLKLSIEERKVLLEMQIAKTAAKISEITGKPNMFLHIYYALLEFLTNVGILKPKTLGEQLLRDEKAKEVFIRKIGDAYKKDDVDRTVLSEIAKKPDDIIKFGKGDAQTNERGLVLQ
ncbi:MAG: hypothetical protein LBJ09_03940 [Clostridiales bacterium]|nr:hypothetical protein [Clostridiales bacterium]